MNIRRIPDPALDGTVWGTGSLLRRGPDIRFFCCDPKMPRTPSHVWWDGIAFRLDQSIFHRWPAETVMRSDDHMRTGFGELELIWDESTSLTLEDLERVQAAVQAETEKP